MFRVERLFRDRPVTTHELSPASDKYSSGYALPAKMYKLSHNNPPKKGLYLQ